MKSPEQVPSDSLEEESVEPYRNQEWEDLQRVSPIEAVRRADQMGVPQEAVDAFIDKVIAEERGKGDTYFLYRFMKYARGGTQEEIRAVGEKVYEASMQNGDFGNAMEIAGDLYGEESEQLETRARIKRARHARPPGGRKADNAQSGKYICGSCARDFAHGRRGGVGRICF